MTWKRKGGERERYRALYGIIIDIMRKRVESIGKVDARKNKQTMKHENIKCQ